MKKWGKISSICLGLLIMSLTVGCGSSRATTSGQERYSVNNSTEDVKEDIASEDMVNGDIVSEETEAGGNIESVPEVNTETPYNRKVIKSGSIHIQTEHFKESVNKLTTYVQSLKGYIETSDIRGADFYDDYTTSKIANLTIRIPQKSFDTFMNKGGDFGNVSYLTSNSEDITSKYVDTETRMKALNIRKEHLLALMEKSGSLDALFKIEKELGDVTYEIESLKGTLQNYDSLVDMATIEVEIQEVGKIEVNKPVKTFGDEIKATFRESVRSVKGIFKGLLLFAIALIPFLIILVPLGLVIYLILKKKKQCQIKGNKEAEENKDNK